MPSAHQLRPDHLADLIASQVNFGLAYIQEARTAYDEKRFEYADLARQIALNAYSTANRFAGRLPKPLDPAVLEQVASFKQELDRLLEKPVAVPEIA
jgi:hypothetical protein